MFLLFLILIANVSTININNIADIGQPCLTPFDGWMFSERYPLFLIHISRFFQVLIHLKKSGPKLQAFEKKLILSCVESFFVI